MGVTKYITTKIDEALKNRLDELRGSIGLSDYLWQMVNFFKMSGAKPSDIETHPTIQLKKDVDRCIAVVRASESGILKKLDVLIKKLDTDQPAVASGSNPEAVPTVSEEMIIQVAAENEKLASRLSASEKRNAELQQELDRLKSAPPTTVNNSKEAIELISWLKTSMRKSTFNDDYYISGSGWQGFKERADKLKIS